MSAPAARRFPLIALAIALVALLLVLAGNLHRISFLPGKPLLSAPGDGSQIAGGDGVAAPVGATIFRVLAVFLAASVLVLLIGAIFHPTYRRILLACLVILGIFWILDRFAARDPEAEAPAEQGAFGPLATGLPTDEIVVPPIEPSSSARLAVAFALAGIAVGAFAYFGHRLALVRRRRRDSASDLDQIADRVGAAADRIRAGADPADAVLRCYAEMLQIVVRVERVNPTHLTPREVAASLRRLGMAAEHVARLTEMFELVRYGARSGRPFAPAALAALDAVRTAYSASGPS